MRTSGRFSVKSKNDTPFAVKRRPTKRPPNPTDLGRTISEHETARLHIVWTNMFRALWSVRCVCQCQRLKIQSHSARRASSGFVSLRNYLVKYLGDLIWGI